jgi:hypothetical protein
MINPNDISKQMQYILKIHYYKSDFPSALDFMVDLLIDYKANNNRPFNVQQVVQMLPAEYRGKISECDIQNFLDILVHDVILNFDGLNYSFLEGHDG